MAGTARGFRDILVDESRARERISAAVRDVFDAAGYAPVETPLLEDRTALEAGGRIKGSPFQLFDSDGRLLILRPDLTLPVARLATSRLASAELPLRLRYAAPVVREQQSLKGQPRQFTQLGIELIGANAGAGEAEVLSLMAQVLQRLGVEAWKIVCGSVVPLTALLECCVADTQLKSQALAYVHNSDLVSLDSLLKDSVLDTQSQERISRLARLCGGVEVLDTLDEYMSEAGVAAEASGVGELRELVSRLDPALLERLSFDFSIINSFDYYTGIVFKAYAEGIAASLGSGGRYDAVLANLGLAQTAACGFAFSLERLQEALGEQGESGVASPGLKASERRLRIAVPKGSLFEQTVASLTKAGLPTSELASPGRQLVVHAPDVDYIIVRAQDAPAFVAFGGADCGVCGYDSLVEANLDLLQLVDLGFGACRFIVAEPAAAKGAAEKAYAWRGSLRVATKYPRIAQTYYDSVGQQVDLVALHGNIELGPMVGMVDRIVDITATGTTLAENDLVVVDEVMKCSARFFASPAAYRCDARVRELARALARMSKEKQDA